MFTCDACSRLLTEFYVIDERHYCRPCVEKHPPCAFCRAPVAPPRKAIDGRAVCDRCAASAVVADRELAALASEAHAWLRARPRLEARARCPIKLVSHGELAAMVAREGALAQGADMVERGLFTGVTRVLGIAGRRIAVQREEPRIFVERGLPRHLMLEVLVHELVHLWQFDHFPHGRVPGQFVEGQACWAQYHFLQDAGYPALARALQSLPGAYGAGFRLVRDIEKKVGFDRTTELLLKWVRKGKYD